MAAHYVLWTTTACLVLWNMLTQYNVNAGIMCYKCDNLPHQSDCTTIIECNDNELCYGEMVLSEIGIITYRSGCKTNNHCVSILAPVVGKRADLIPCTKCCSTPYCNFDLCEIPVTNNTKRCLSCPYEVHPQDCHHSIQCSSDEICYTQTIVHNQEKRYRLGCVHKNQCAIVGNPLQVGIGRRQTRADYCGVCCDNPYGNCNRDLCTPGVNITTYSLVQPPSLTFCRDNSTSFCTAAKTSDPNICSLDYYKYYQCPYTCGTCGGTGLIVTNSPPLTTQTIAIQTTDACQDIATHCDTSLVCLIPDIAKLCKKSCHLCGGTGPIVTNVPTHPTAHSIVSSTTGITTTTRPSHCPSKDPILECQCKYLDQEVDLCKESESDLRLRRFCCYYCNRKKGITRCPDAECDRLEKAEQDLVDNMNHGITCTATE